MCAVGQTVAIVVGAAGTLAERELQRGSELQGDCLSLVTFQLALLNVIAVYICVCVCISVCINVHWRYTKLLLRSAQTHAKQTHLAAAAYYSSAIQSCQQHQHNCSLTASAQHGLALSDR